MGTRFKTGVYIDKELWKSFKKDVTNKGFSTCFILETLLRGYMCVEGRKGAHLKNSTESRIVVNQNIIYEVSRARRRKSYAENCYLNGDWSFRKPLENEPVSSLGHVIECECQVCRPRISRKFQI